jgi:hypothetical protein
MVKDETADEGLKRHQLACLWLDGQATLRGEADAIRFVRAVGFALRYNATPGLPMASMFRAAGEKRRAIELTNLLLARAEVVETNLIAERLVLIQRGLVPAVYELRKRKRSAQLSPDAKRALDLIGREGQATAGDVRRCLRIAGRKRPDRADVALAELQHEMLVDRGPSSVPKRGIPYLSPEGFPYRAFEKAHPELVRSAGKLTVEDAVCSVVETYLRAALFVTPRKLTSMFKLLFSDAEAGAAIATLVRTHRARQTGTLVVRAALPFG